MQTLTQPTSLTKPFAESGDKNTLYNNNPDPSTYPQRADLVNGFPQITSEAIDDGGLPPERKDFNALGYLSTIHNYFQQAGGCYTYNATIATAIGGYPMNARLWYTDGSGNTFILRSTKQNNTDNFVTTPAYIGTSWVVDVPALSSNNTWTGTNNFQNPTEDTSTSTQADTVGARNSKINSMRSNCIPEIPQNIKLELSSGVLTLKSGSKVTIPRSGGHDTYTLTSDISRTLSLTADTKFLLFLNQTSVLTAHSVDYCYASASSSPPSAYTYMFWLDTTNNTIKYTSDGGSTWTSYNTSYPLGVITSDSNGNVAKIDYVFNGFGFIGSAGFKISGTKFLIPDGLNSDGSLKNIEYTTSASHYNRTWTSTQNQVFVIRPSGNISFANKYFESETMPTDNDYTLWYKPSTNTIKYNSTGNDLTDENDSNWQLGYGIPVSYIGTGNAIDPEQWMPKSTFHALDKSDLPFMWSQKAETTAKSNPSVVIEEGTGYIKYSSGVMIQWGILNETSQFPAITLNQPYINKNYVGLVSSQAGGGADRAVTSIYNYETTWFQARIQNTSASEFRWMTIGMWK